jgi:hypothetical protein
MRYLFLCALALFLCTCAPSPDGEATTGETMEAETTETDDEGWEILFDGDDVDKWRGYNRDDFPNQGWRVENGELMVEYSGTEEDGYGGDIITKDKFKDFEFEVEFNLSDTANSGILYLVREVEDTPIWHSAPEYQLLDDETYKVTYPELTDRQMTGANYDMHAQPKNFSNPIGEWNTARIVKRGPHVEHWLNDSLVIAYDLHDNDWEQRYQASKFKDYPTYASVDEGHIGLQDHGHLVRFRNVRIKRLE